jgi:hypothetical protein
MLTRKGSEVVIICNDYNSNLYDITHNAVERVNANQIEYWKTYPIESV